MSDSQVSPAERVLTIADRLSETVCECLFLWGQYGKISRHGGKWMVYFLQDMRQDRIKIGYSDNIDVRIHQLRLENNRRRDSNRRIMHRNYHEKRRDDMGQLRVLAKLEGGRERERELHAQFKADRLKKNTRMSEWFRMSDNLCCFISRLNPRLRLLSDSGKIWQDGVNVAS